MASQRQREIPRRGHDRPWWSRRVALLGGQGVWRERSTSAILDAGGSPEILPSPSGISSPPDVAGVLLVLDPRRDGANSESLDALATWNLQPVTIVGLPPVSGATRVLREARRSGFRHFYTVGRQQGLWRDIQGQIQVILDSRLWVIARLAVVLDPSQSILWPLAVLQRKLPTVRTVAEWSRMLEFSDYRQVGRLFAMEGVSPRPKRMLDWVRLINAVAIAVNTSPRATRGDVAEELLYSSGDYLGKTAKRLTGRAFGELVERGPIGTIEVFRNRESTPA